MKKLFITLTLLVAAVVAPQSSYAEGAEDAAAKSAWTLGGNFSLSLSQASFSNWASGGENSVGLNLQLNYSADYEANKHIFKNRIELAYGLNNTQSVGNRKTNDKIYLSSTYGYEVGKNLYLSGLFTFQTQFANGYTYNTDSADVLISTIMSPGYLTLGAGLTWTPKSWFTATLTPATWREVFVLNEDLSDAGSFGVDVGQHAYAEAGANLQLVVNKDIMKNVNLYTRLNLFSNYLEDAENVDVDWEVQLSMKINKWLSASVSTNLAYDDNIDIVRKDGSVGPALQFKENIGVGLQVAF
ncbi:MAG: DUF3078 domain-containing protein [Rikenellaceae bacterium]